MISARSTYHGPTETKGSIVRRFPYGLKPTDRDDEHQTAIVEFADYVGAVYHPGNKFMRTTERGLPHGRKKR